MQQPTEPPLPPEMADPEMQKRLALASILGVGCAPVLVFGFAGAIFAFLFFYVVVLITASMAIGVPAFLLARRIFRLRFEVSAALAVLLQLVGQLAAIPALVRPDLYVSAGFMVLVSLAVLWLVVRWLDGRGHPFHAKLWEL